MSKPTTITPGVYQVAHAVKPHGGEQWQIILKGFQPDGHEHLFTNDATFVSDDWVKLDANGKLTHTTKEPL